MSSVLNLIWSCFDYVWNWANVIYDSFNLDIESLVLGAVVISGIIGFILSPYLKNPAPSADKLRQERSKKNKSK